MPFVAYAILIVKRDQSTGSLYYYGESTVEPHTITMPMCGELDMLEQMGQQQWKLATKIVEMNGIPPAWYFQKAMIC